MYLKKPIVICCLCFLGFAKLAYSSEVLSTPPPSEEIPELTDQEVRDAAEEELERLKQKLEYLDELIDDAEGYGEEPYQATEDGGYITGNEAVEAAENTIENTEEMIEEIEEALNEDNTVS